MGRYIITSGGELYHYGVKGMKWGVRQAREAGRDLDRKMRSYKQANRAYKRAVSKDASLEDITYKRRNRDQAKANYEQAKLEFNENAPTRVKAERGAKRAAIALAAIGTTYVVDKKYLGGVGTATAKVTTEAAVKVIGMTAMTAFTMARGHTNLKWTT